MKALFTALLVLNLALVAYTMLAPSRPAADANALGPLNADQIRIIPARSAVVAGQGACVQWGPFRDAELDSVRRELARVGLGARSDEVKMPVVAGWWVFIPPLRDRAEVDRQISELQSLGITDYYAVESEGPMRNAISLGAFRNEEAARAFLVTLREKGVRTARASGREQRVTQTMVRIPDPDGQAITRLAELAARFPGSELKQGDCGANGTNQ